LSPALIPLGQELVELGLVFGQPQPVEEGAEVALLLFEPAQRLIAILIEGAIAARRRRARSPAPEPLVGVALPAGKPAMLPASHSSAPQEKGEGGEPQWPEQHEAQHHERNPGRLADLVQPFRHSRRDAHGSLYVNVNNINIGSR